jgi:hypothetical protein
VTNTPSDFGQALLPFELSQPSNSHEAAAPTSVGAPNDQTSQNLAIATGSGDLYPHPVRKTTECPDPREVGPGSASLELPHRRQAESCSLGSEVPPTPSAGESASLYEQKRSRQGALQPDSLPELHDIPLGRILSTSSQITTGNVTLGDHPPGRILSSSSTRTEQEAAGSSASRLTASALKQLLPVLARLDDRRHAVRDTRSGEHSRVSPSHAQRSAGDRTASGTTGSPEAPDHTNIHEGGQP